MSYLTRQDELLEKAIVNVLLKPAIEDMLSNGYVVGDNDIFIFKFGLKKKGRHLKSQIDVKLLWKTLETKYSNMGNDFKKTTTDFVNDFKNRIDELTDEQRVELLNKFLDSNEYKEEEKMIERVKKENNNLQVWENLVLTDINNPNTITTITEAVIDSQFILYPITIDNKQCQSCGNKSDNDRRLICFDCIRGYLRFTNTEIGEINSLLHTKEFYRDVMKHYRRK